MRRSANGLADITIFSCSSAYVVAGLLRIYRSGPYPGEVVLSAVDDLAQLPGFHLARSALFATDHEFGPVLPENFHRNVEPLDGIWINARMSRLVFDTLWCALWTTRSIFAAMGSRCWSMMTPTASCSSKRQKWPTRIRDWRPCRSRAACGGFPKQPMRYGSANPLDGVVASPKFEYGGTRNILQYRHAKPSLITRGTAD